MTTMPPNNWHPWIWHGPHHEHAQMADAYRAAGVTVIEVPDVAMLSPKIDCFAPT